MLNLTDKPKTLLKIRPRPTWTRTINIPMLITGNQEPLSFVKQKDTVSLSVNVGVGIVTIATPTIPTFST